MWKILEKNKAIDYIQWLKNDTVVEVTKKTEKSVRTYRQIKYYFWVVIAIISDFHWYNAIEANEMVKLTFKRESFTDLETKEFENIMEIIRQLWMNKYWVKIPKPNEEKEIESIQKAYFWGSF